MIIEGHTDAVGSDAYNQQLSQRRASVRAYLIEACGIEARPCAMPASASAVRSPGPTLRPGEPSRPVPRRMSCRADQQGCAGRFGAQAVSACCAAAPAWLGGAAEFEQFARRHGIGAGHRVDLDAELHFARAAAQHAEGELVVLAFGGQALRLEVVVLVLHLADLTAGQVELAGRAHLALAQLADDGDQYLQVHGRAPVVRGRARQRRCDSRCGCVPLRNFLGMQRPWTHFRRSPWGPPSAWPR